MRAPAPSHPTADPLPSTDDHRGRVATAVRASRPNVARRLPGPRHSVLIGLLLLSALWGWIVDAPIIPVLAPTGNSTIFQATTAAAFALLGIFFGPTAGALGGLIRDGTGYALVLAVHPHGVLRVGMGGWLGRAAVDTIEDMVLGWIPGLVARRVRRVGLLALASAASAWISLPFLVVGMTIFSGHANHLWHALITPVGDWNEPVDPGLTVYALVTGAAVAFALSWWSTSPRRSLATGVGFLLPALGLIALGAHY